MNVQPSYEGQIENMLKQLQSQNYTFEVTKCCGYSTFVLVKRNGTLMDLYKNISQHFECPNIRRLFVVNEQTREQIQIPLTDMINIRDYIVKQPRECFTPVYPVPHTVVFRIYLDDGHHHVHENTDISGNVFNVVT
jgi:hypothetical protein